MDGRGRYHESVIVIGVARYPGKMSTDIFTSPMYIPYGIPTCSLNFGYDDKKLNLDRSMRRRLGLAARSLHHHHNLEVNSLYYDVSEATGCRQC